MQHTTDQRGAHTPGPWEITHTVATNRVNIFGTAKNQEYHIGTLQGSSEMDLDVFKANAQLIAAAPQMLDALKRCVRYLDDLDESGYGSKNDNPCYIDAVAAIAAAQVAK